MPWGVIQSARTTGARTGGWGTGGLIPPPVVKVPPKTTLKLRENQGVKSVYRSEQKESKGARGGKRGRSTLPPWARAHLPSPSLRADPKARG